MYSYISKISGRKKIEQLLQSMAESELEELSTMEEASQQEAEKDVFYKWLKTSFFLPSSMVKCLWFQVARRLSSSYSPSSSPRKRIL